MNQQKTGEFLKGLRREKGLTQELLAERFYVSSRTVSRWETGSNLPDIGTLIELADFYGVDIREIIDGERKGENMDQETKKTMIKVAEYATEKEKLVHAKTLYTVLGVSIVLFVSTFLFAGNVTGVLYGIVPEGVCDLILVAVYGFSLALFVAWIRARWALETPTAEPERTVAATVVSKEVVSGTRGAGRSKLGYSFVIHFATEDGRMLEIFAYEEEFGRMREGMQGQLTFQGRYFVDFE